MSFTASIAANIRNRFFQIVMLENMHLYYDTVVANLIEILFQFLYYFVITLRKIKSICKLK